MTEAKVIDFEAPQSRPFTLGDVMIHIVALALGLMVARSAIRLIVGAIRVTPRSNIGGLDTVAMGRFLNIVLLNFLGFLLPAFLIPRLRRPRPPLRSIIGQPGYAGCAAPVVLFLDLTPLPLLAPAAMEQAIIESAVQVLIVATVPLAWVALSATGRWVPEPSWIDRLGRVLGVMWTISLTAHLVLIRLPW